MRQGYHDYTDQVWERSRNGIMGFLIQVCVSTPVSLNFVKLWNPDERRNDGITLNVRY